LDDRTGFLKAVSFNVCGLKNKCHDSHFQNFISQYDVIILLETFISESEWEKIANKFSNFKVHIIFATRAANCGRYIGGVLYLINYQSPFAERMAYVVCEHFTLIHIETAENEGLNLLPAYLNCNFWERDFKNIETFLCEHEVQNLLILGDLNARIGEEQMLTEGILSEVNGSFSEVRVSKDSVVNSRGRKILRLVDNLGLVILNGRAEGDKKGDYTFVGAMGCSVIDLAAASIECLGNKVHSFRVVSHTGSDHLPIEVGVKMKTTMVGRREGQHQLLRLLPKLKWGRNDEMFYQDRMEQNIRSLELCQGDQENVSNLIKVITDSAHSKLKGHKESHLNHRQPWFDFECLSLRKRKFKLLNVFRRKNTIESKQMYITACKDFKTVCKHKQKLHLQTVISNLENVTDAKNCWRAINSFKLKADNVVGNITPEEWVRHFKNLLNPPLLSASVSYAEPLIRDEGLDAPFTLTELKAALAAAPNNKSPGADRVPYEFFKNAPETFLSKLLLVYNKMYETGKVPDSFKKATIFPLFKKGDANDANNYRGLSFIDCIAKLFTSLLNRRLTRWVEERQIITECQAGFRKGFSTMDNIFNLTGMIHLKTKSKKGKLYAFFVDFKAAYDTIDRKALWFKLSRMGVSTKLLTIIKNLYEGTEAGVWCREGVTGSFKTEMGLKQGCILSPILFSLFINDLPEFLEGGCEFGGFRVNTLMYADDLVLLASTPAGLQHMINRLEAYCNLWNLKVNLIKSKIMVCRNGGKMG